MIGATNPSSVSVLSAQQMQAQRDAQTARAKAQRLANESAQASQEAQQATQRSERLGRQSQTYNREADRAQSQAEQQPAQRRLDAPPAADGTAPTERDDPLPATPLTTQQAVGRSVLESSRAPLPTLPPTTTPGALPPGGTDYLQKSPWASNLGTQGAVRAYQQVSGFTRAAEQSGAGTPTVIRFTA